MPATETTAEDLTPAQAAAYKAWETKRARKAAANRSAATRRAWETRRARKAEVEAVIRRLRQAIVEIEGVIAALEEE